MASSLPNNPSLDRLKRDARSLQRHITASDPAALVLVRRHHPRPEVALAQVPQRFALNDAQLTVARGYGFTGWPALVQHLQVAKPLSLDPATIVADQLEPADLFCALGSLYYNDSDAPPRWQRAAEMLAASPELVDTHVWAAGTATDPAALRRHLSRDPGSARRRGGPFGRGPLMYLCYSRVPLDRTETEVIDAARLLLEAGADPNEGYLWCGMATPFTLLTGVFGEGEQGQRRQPRHPHDQALAALLLEHGAHPADQQTLYNRMFSPDDSHLELLFAHGLGTVGPGPWERQLGEAMETHEQMWRRQISWAADHGFTDRLELLARHGVEVGDVVVTLPSIPDDVDALDERGRTALHQAAWEGDLDRIQELLAAGADPKVIDRRFGTTPLGWAEHAYQDEAADLLRPLTRE